MSILNSVKDAVFGQAVKLAGNPRLGKLVTDPRVMNAAMKAMSLGGQLKGELDRAGRVAAGVFGLATQDEVASLRSTIAGLEDTVSGLEAKAAAATAEAQQATAALAAAESSAASAASAAGRKKAQPQNS